MKKKQQNETLARQIEGLPREEQLVLSLRYADGLTVDEVAAVLAIDTDEALVRIRRARDKLDLP